MRQCDHSLSFSSTFSVVSVVITAAALCLTFPHAESVRRSLAARVRHRSGSQAYLPLTPVVAERGSSVYGGS